MDFDSNSMTKQLDPISEFSVTVTQIGSNDSIYLIYLLF